MKENQFYCMACRKRCTCPSTHIEFQLDKNGRPRLYGDCKCGTDMYKYVKYSQADRLAKKY